MAIKVATPAPKQTVKILGCTCAHEYQDKKYGPHQRVHTRTKVESGGKGAEKTVEWRCTVCMRVRPSREATE